MFIDRCYEKEDNVNNNMNYQMDNNSCCPVMECPQENVCHRQIMHNVNHIVPVHTRIINHHIVRHTYQPCYTYSCEDEVCNVYDKC